MGDMVLDGYSTDFFLFKFRRKMTIQQFSFLFSQGRSEDARRGGKKEGGENGEEGGKKEGGEKGKKGEKKLKGKEMKDIWREKRDGK